MQPQFRLTEVGRRRYLETAGEPPTRDEPAPQTRCGFHGLVAGLGLSDAQRSVCWDFSRKTDEERGIKSGRLVHSSRWLCL